jgi:hypothetical protein
MAPVPAVLEWHRHLSEKQQLEWSSLSSVIRHCPVFAKAKGGDGSKPVPVGKPGKMHVEVAVDTIVDYCGELAVDERMQIIERILSPLGLQLATPLVKKQKAEPAR